jgi:hypothetical protein
MRAAAIGASADVDNGTVRRGRDSQLVNAFGYGRCEPAGKAESQFAGRGACARYDARPRLANLIEDAYRLESFEHSSQIPAFHAGCNPVTPGNQQFLALRCADETPAEFFGRSGNYDQVISGNVPQWERQPHGDKIGILFREDKARVARFGVDVILCRDNARLRFAWKTFR